MTDWYSDWYLAGHEGRRGPFINAFTSPADLPGLVAWYTADQGVFSDFGTTPALDEQVIQQWNDISGNANHLQEATNGPEFDTTGFNGAPAVRFFPATMQVSSAVNGVVFNSSAMSAFVVGTMTTTTANFGRLLSFRGNGQSTDFDNTGGFQYPRNGTSNGISPGFNSAGDTQAISLATNYRLGLTISGTAITSYVNNVAGAGGTSAGALNLTNGTLCIGAVAIALGTNWAGAVAEVVLVNRAITSTERTNLDDYFKTHWGL